LHGLAAGVSGLEEWSVSDGEAKALAGAVGAVAETYDVSFDPQTAAWINLGVVAAGVYGPRLMLTAMKLSRGRSQPPAKVAA
jgi:hypothetical protein